MVHKRSCAPTPFHQTHPTHRPRATLNQSFTVHTFYSSLKEAKKCNRSTRDGDVPTLPGVHHVRGMAVAGAHCVTACLST